MIVLLRVLLALVGLVGSPTTTDDAATYAYDTPTIARVDVRHSFTVETETAQLSGALNRVVSASFGGRATSTTSVRSFVATNTVDDHIVLGIREGLEDTASSVGGRTLLNDPNWRTTLMESIGNPNTRFTVSLDGFSGTGTYSQVMGAAQRGATPLARATEWEIMQLQQAGRLGDVTFVRGGQAVPNPWAG